MDNSDKIKILGSAILQIIFDLKKVIREDQNQLTAWYEFFEADEDFDILVTVKMLRPKKSQKEIGM